MGTKQDPSQTPQQPNDDPDELPENIGRAINAAVTSQLKRHLKDVVTKADLESVSASLVEKVTAALPKPEPDEGKKGGKQPGDDPEVAKLRKDLEAMKAQHAEATKRAQETERTAKVKETVAQIGTLLDGGLDPKLKVRGEYRDLLLEHFGGRVKVLDDGAVVVKSRRAPSKGLPEEDVDLPADEAVRDWFKSEKAKAYLPAPAPGGGGDGKKPRMLPRSGAQPAASGQTESDDLESGIRRTAEMMGDKLRGL